MKKTLFLIFFLIGITAFAQTWTPVKNTYNTRQKYTQMVKGDSVAALAYIVNEGSSNSYARWLSTTGTTVDTVVFGFTPKSVTVINDNSSTDTLFVSSSGSFPSTNTIKRLGGEGFAKYWATDTIFVKVATTPAASKKLRIEAN